jgi:hypothetical protein
MSKTHASGSVRDAVARRLSVFIFHTAHWRRDWYAWLSWAACSVARRVFRRSLGAERKPVKSATTPGSAEFAYGGRSGLEQVRGQLDER